MFSSAECASCKTAISLSNNRTGLSETTPCKLYKDPVNSFYSESEPGVFKCMYIKPYEFGELTNVILNKLMIAFNSRTTNGTLDISTCITFLKMFFKEESVIDYIDILIELDFEYNKKNNKKK